MTDVDDAWPEPEGQHPGSTPASKHGTAKHGTALWTFEASDEISDLDVSGEMVFLGAGSTVSALDAATGGLRWQFIMTPTSRDPHFNQVRLSAGTDALYVARDTSVTALNIATGRRRWSIDMGPVAAYEPILGARVTAIADAIYATAANRVVALDPDTGRALWTHEVGQRFAGSPCVEAGRLFVTSGADIEALDPATGTLLWRHGNGQNLFRSSRDIKQTLRVKVSLSGVLDLGELTMIKTRGPPQVLTCEDPLNVATGWS